MPHNVIAIEALNVTDKEALQKLMLLVPPDQRKDKDLMRLLAFRLKLDGFTATRQYLVRKTRDADKCAYPGRLYDYLKNDREEKQCGDRGADGSNLSRLAQHPGGLVPQRSRIWIHRCVTPE